MAENPFLKYDPVDTAPLADALSAQAALFAGHLQYLASRSPYYRELFRREKIEASKLTLDDIASLPITGKEEFSADNDAFLAVPSSEIVDIVLSSGTTGRPTRMMYTEADLQRLAYNELVAMRRVGIGPGDVALLTCTLDRCFIAGLAYYSGIRAVGAAAIRNGVNSPESHTEVIGRLRPTVLVGVPSFLVKLGKFMRSRGLDPAASGVRKMVCIGEPLRERGMRMHKLGSDLEDIWQAKAYSTYASSETITTFCECGSQAGGHLHPALGVVEIVDDAGAVLPAGEAGEVVVTPLQMQGMPLLRFRTGDVSFLIEGPCACGRTTPRLGPILGRKKQMIKLAGTTLYPQAVFTALDEMPGVVEYYIEVASDYALSDQVEVHVAVAQGGAGIKEIESGLQARLRVRPRVFVDPEAEVRARVYDPASRKPVRFFDMRGK